MKNYRKKKSKSTALRSTEWREAIPEENISPETFVFLNDLFKYDPIYRYPESVL